MSDAAHATAKDVAPESVPRAAGQSPASTSGPGPSVLALQRSAGNAAVARTAVQRSQATVQRIPLSGKYTYNVPDQEMGEKDLGYASLKGLAGGAGEGRRPVSPSGQAVGLTRTAT